MAGKRESQSNVSEPESRLHLKTAEILRELIVRGDLRPGQPLNELALSKTLGLSRTPLREALKLLAKENLVELRRNRSSVVAPLREKAVVELFEAMAGLERLAGEMAARRITPRELQKLRSLQVRLERFHNESKLTSYFEVNNQIHSFIVDCARNQVLRECHEVVMTRVMRARFLALATVGRRDESVREHRQILKALEEKDEKKAGELLAKHVDGTGAAVNRGLWHSK